MVPASTLGDLIHREKPAIVSFVGAGGKTSLMFALARELFFRIESEQAPERLPEVIVTTTTNLSAHEIPGDFAQIQWNGRDDVDAFLRAAAGEKKTLLVYGGLSGSKLEGIDPQTITGLAAPGCVILVEADGARGRPLKRLRSHEPVIPRGPLPAMVCIVVGLDALLKPLDEESCFNHSGVVNEGIAEEGTLLSPGLMRDILFAPPRGRGTPLRGNAAIVPRYSPGGYASAIPAGHDAILLINKADLMPSAASRETIARQLYHPMLRSVFLTSVRGGQLEATEATNADDRVCAVVLGAGKSVRFGSLKQAEPIDNTCLLGIVVRNALRSGAFERVVLVLGYEAEKVKRALGPIADNDKLDIVINHDYEKGMSTSLRAGVEHAAARGCDAVAFLPGDMPLLDSGLIAAVLARYRASCSRLCYARTSERPGHPVVIRRNLFDEIRAITGDTGAREVVRNNLEWALGVAVEDQETDRQFDIDTKEDLKKYLSRHRRSGHL